MNKKIFTLLILLLLLPVTALAAGEIELYVAGQRITESGCYANQDGTWTKVDGTEPASGQFYYDAATGTLTLNGAEISHNEDVSVGSGDKYSSSVIAFSQSADVSLNIVVSQGTSTITGTGGIRVESTTGNASLSIKGPGSLDVELNGTVSGITLGGLNVNLDIDGADVTASSPTQYGVYLISRTDASSTSSITVNNGSLTTGGDGYVGIYYSWDDTVNGTSSLTVSGNAVVDTRNSRIMGTGVQVGAGSDGNGGIVFNGKNGTVYGDVTLQEDLEIKNGEILTIPEGASLTVPEETTLTNNGTITNDGTIILNGVLTGKVEGTGSIPITGITLDETELSLDVDGTYILQATLNPTITTETVIWSSSDESIIKIENGTVTAVAVGKAIITVKSPSNESIYTTCTVTVVHKWGDVSYIWSKDAEGNLTCTATRTCENNDEHIETVTATVTSEPTKAPTCTEKGEMTYTATFSETWAETQTTTEVIDAIGHGEIEIQNAKEATCTEDGYTGDEVCTVCGEVVTAGEIIPATGHHYVNGYCTECGHRDPNYVDPISYYNIYVEDVCDGVEVTTSKNVVREGGSISLYVEKDTAHYTFDNFKVYYKRSYYGGWEELKEGTQPGEYPIKNIWTHIYIKAEGAEEKEDPTGIEQVEGVKVYTKDGSLYVQTPQREVVIIVSMSGAVVKNEEQVGLKQYHGLQPGIYIVRVGDKAYKLRLN